MDKDYFMNAGISQQHFDTIPWSSTGQSYLDPNSTMDHQYSHFDSSLSSMASSPAGGGGAAAANEAFLLRELIGKLGGGAGPTNHNNNNNDSSYNNTPLNSPILDQLNLSPHLGNSNALTHPLPSLSSDPGFAERAAKFSCFGSRSFNGRTNPFGNESPHNRSKSPLIGSVKLPRVSSTPVLKNSSPPQMEIRPSDQKLGKLPGSGANSNEESSVSEQIPSGEMGSGSKMSIELNSNTRKRKAAVSRKPKQNGSNPAKGVGSDEDDNAKRSKPAENGKDENGDKKKTEEEQKADEKPPEPFKDYIHVRARRGQATDSHSLAERVRREKISERMKLLQDLVPGCNKVTGKALMLDEIINYVQSLQRQVEFLSMKLSSVNPEMDVNMDNLLSKDVFQQNASLPQQMYPMDSSTPAFYQQNVQQQLHNSTNVSSGPLSQCSVDPLPLGIQLDGFTENLQQFPGFSEDDLHSIVGFVHNHVNFPVPNQASNMKAER